jgi:hypothetical protein
MTSKIIVNNIEADTGINTVTFNDDISSNTVRGNVIGDITSSGTSTFDVISGVSTIGVAQTFYGISSGTGTLLGSVNDLNHPVILQTGTYSAHQRKPGIVWKSNNENPNNPKNAIFTEEHGTGSELHFATSSSYVSGITTSAYVDEQGRFVSSQSTYACAYGTGTQTRASSGWVKITLNSFFASNVTFDNANDRFVIIDPGIYHIIAEIGWSASNSGGAWTPSIGIYRNGSTDVFHSYLHEVYNAGYSQTIMISRTRPLDEGDQIELWWQQNTSSTNTFTNRSHLSIMKVI